MKVNTQSVAYKRGYGHGRHQEHANPFDVATHDSVEYEAGYARGEEKATSVTAPQQRFIDALINGAARLVKRQYIAPGDIRLNEKTVRRLSWRGLLRTEAYGIETFAVQPTSRSTGYSLYRALLQVAS